MEYRFIAVSFKQLITLLENSVTSYYNSTNNIKMSAFIVFIICIVFTYLIFWTPFVNKLNREVIIFTINML